MDGSVVPLEGKFYHGSRRQFEIDYSKCKTLSPYRPSYEDISLPGNSPIVELPVTAYLPELCYRDQYFPLTKQKPEERLLSKWHGRERTGVDVFHIFWHPQDLWRPHDAWYPQEAGKPKKISSGKVISEPLPARVLMNPAANPAMITAAYKYHSKKTPFKKPGCSGLVCSYKLLFCDR